MQQCIPSHLIFDSFLLKPSLFNVVMTKPHHFILFSQYIDNLSTSLSKGITHNCISFSIQYHHIPLTLLKSAAYKRIMSLSQPPWGKTAIKNVNSEVCQNGRQSSMACLLQWGCQRYVKLDFCLKGTDTVASAKWHQKLHTDVQRQDFFPSSPTSPWWPVDLFHLQLWKE